MLYLMKHLHERDQRSMCCLEKNISVVVVGYFIVVFVHKHYIFVIFICG